MTRPNTARSHRGFTLIEVLVALAIVSVTLMAGLRASATMTRSTERQTGRVLAQLCAENALVQVRLSRQLPDVGDTQRDCPQAGQTLQLRLLVQPTPNPNFRRIEARVAQGGVDLLQLNTVVGRY
ncbi:type II secretion system minor pseudopilin GspI [Rhodoferax sp. OV413]|uniref:type II secretion system minor pseudopilin GspI n=1 Tax=Rhodoferax sp. OV413 TaxID=1855285 RepID=UPI0025FEF208|nr:type II secretion system minor pseudopilin GspI [Rhodoferax sp. OV413]